MASTSSWAPFVSQEEFNLFHRIDRELYTILAVNIGRDPMEAMQIMAFWLWLERVGFRNIVSRMLSLPVLLISELADEAAACLACITSGDPPPSSDDLHSIPLTQSFMQKEISLLFLHENRQTAAEGVAKVLSDVCYRALQDIMQRAVGLRALAGVAAGARAPAPEERAMFVTFSKGYPVQEWEVREFFTGMYGDCIEEFQMQQVEPSEQALFARVVFRSASTVEMVLGGGQRIKFTINGKHIWARKFIPKRPPPSPSVPPYSSHN